MATVNPFDVNTADRFEVAIRVLEVWRDYEPRRDDKGNEVPGEFNEVHKVKWVKKGSPGSETEDKVARVKKHNPAVWSVVGPYYERWLEGQEDPVDGTPLEAWPAVNKRQVDLLRLLHLRTVEDVAGATDADLERMGMGSRGLRDKARAYVTAKSGDAQIAARLSERDTEIEDLKRQVAELIAANDSLTAKRKPGPKPKDVAAEGAE